MTSDQIRAATTENLNKMTKIASENVAKYPDHLAVFDAMATAHQTAMISEIAYQLAVMNEKHDKGVLRKHAGLDIRGQL